MEFRTGIYSLIMRIRNLHALFKPNLYHGWGKSRNYFEGLYFKIVNRTEDRIFAIIPGISMDSKGERHSFIQVLDGVNLKSEYYSFGFEEFIAAPKAFRIKIGANFFSNEGIKIELPEISGELEMSEQVRWPSSWYSPGVMGPYSFVPFMECNHGILSMNHSLSGGLKINNEIIDFSGGKGYTEKDWGKSFPEAYIWMHSNHFDHDMVSMKISVAKIPWMGSSFVGFISGLWFNGKIFEFTKYNNSRLRKLEITDEKVFLVLENKNYKMEISCSRPSATKLASPISGNMSGHIHESMKALMALSLYDKVNNKVLLEAKGRNSALEVAGCVEQLVI
jgi:hypothetical protein